MAKPKPVVRPAEFTPSIQILIGLGSIAVHADEMFSPTGHPFDKTALKAAFETPGVRDWIAAMTAQGLLPVKR